MAAKHDDELVAEMSSKASGDACTVVMRPVMEFAMPTLPPGVTSDWRHITRDEALALLETKKGNRAISQDHVQRLKRDMMNGAWRLSHQGICLDRDGCLLDGEHRLWAFVESGLPSLLMLVTRGLDDDSRATFDTHRVRSTADALRIIDGVDGARRIVPLFRAIENLKNKHPTALSVATMRVYLKLFADSIAWFLADGPKRRPLNRAGVCGALVFVHHVEPVAVAEFTRQYLSGANLAEGDPAFTLRTLVIEGLPIRRENERSISLKTLRALAAHLDGEQIDQLRPVESLFDRFAAMHAERGAR